MSSLQTLHPADAAPLVPRSLRHDVLPFLASLLLHAGIVVVGVVAFHVVRTAAGSAAREQIIIPEMGRLITDPTNGSLTAGAADPNRPAAQADFPDVKDASGLSSRPAHDLSKSLGEAGEAELAVGVAGMMPRTVGTHGSGGEGDPGGGFARFGVPGGGGGGTGLGVSFIRGPVTNARRIVFVCDASGSMMKSFDSLRVELRKSVESLRPPQSFNVLFFQENAPPPMDRGLIFVTPENKRRAFEYVDKSAARGPTDPLPALRLALDMKPELMFFLIDPSDFPDKPAVIDLFRKANADKRMKLNTIAFIDRNADDEAFLKQLARENGGVFRYVSEDDLGR